MTGEELESLVLNEGNPKKLANAFANLSEKDRKTLSTAAQRLLKQLEANKPNKTASAKLVKHIKARKGEVWKYWNSPSTVNSRLAVLAVGPLSAIKRLNNFWDDKNLVALDEIIRDRNPDWLNEWVDHALSQEFKQLSFGMIWAWVKDGVCDQPENDGYYEEFANYMMSTGVYGRGPGMPISKALKTEPQLKEYVWSLFKIESNAFNTNSWFKKGAGDDYETWTEALIKLSAAGDLDRQRLLDVSLDGLWADLKQNQLSGFHKFHKTLAPTNDERAARQSSYLSLLSHSVGHVVKFGLENASALEKAKQLDAKTFLAEVPNVFVHDAKGNAVTAVKLMGRLLKSQPNNTKDVLTVLPEALRHPHTDVQKLTLTILDQNSAAINDAVRKNIAAAGDFVSPSVRLQLAPYLDVGTTQENVPEPTTSDDRDLSKIDPRQMKALRIKELSKDGAFEYWPVSQNILDHDILPTIAKIEPITNEDDLIALIYHAAEVVDSPDDIERILDGISRNAGSFSSDFKEKTAPLLLRLENKSQFESDKGLRAFGNVSKSIMDLVLTWLTGKFHATPDQKFQKHVTAFIPAALYVKEITSRVSKKQSRPLLSFPTHAGGWIDPVVWVERLKKFETNNVKLSELEISLSVLRLAPDNREKALKAADGLKSYWGRLARFALGRDEKLTPKDKKQYGMWISAARCRDPYGDVSTLLEPLKLKDTLPDSLQPARYDWRAYTRESKSDYSDEIYKYSEMSIEVKTSDGVKMNKPGILPRLKNPLTTEWERIPTAAPHLYTRQKYFWSSELNSIYLSQWLGYQWPLNQSASHILGVEALMSRIDEDGSSWEPNFGYMDSLFQTNRPWLEPGHLLLCVALAGKDADARGLAIDAVIEGIEKGLLDTDICASVLTRLSEGGWLKLNRLGDNLMTVVEASKLHAAVVSNLLQKWVQKTDLKQRYMFRILEVLLEAQSTLGRSLSSDTHEPLKTIKGSGKAAKVAKSLIGLKDSSGPILDTELKNLAIGGRL